MSVSGSRSKCISALHRVCFVLAAIACGTAASVGGGVAQTVSEKLALAREHRGTAIQVPAELLLPAGTGKVPAMVVEHGSSGVTAAREYRYARELVAMGVAALVIDSFKPRGIANTVSHQEAVSAAEMAGDTFAALKVLAAHPRIDPARIGLVGFSKGGTVALTAAHERQAAGARLPGKLRFALNVSFYPACSMQYFRPKTTGAPIYLLLGGADTYVGVAPCLEYAEKLKAQGATVVVNVYPDAPHGFDGDRDYKFANGQNWSRCIFEEQPDGSWKDRTTGKTTIDKRGRRVSDGFRAAVAACRKRGVSGGPNAAARAASMQDLKEAVRKHLLDGK